jgi:ribosomal protein S6E (S10)
MDVWVYRREDKAKEGLMPTEYTFRFFPVISLLIAITTAGVGAAEPVFQEQGGLVVIEAESISPGDNWVTVTGAQTLEGSRTTAGATGEGCIRFTGNNECGGGASGTMTYKINITDPGEYRLKTRSYGAPIESGRSDCANDMYVKMAGQSGSCLGSFHKWYIGGQSPWHWSWNTKLECNHSGMSVTYEFDAGIHEFSIAGRSKNYLLDRIIMYKSSVSNPEDLSHPESPTGSGGDPGDPGDPPTDVAITSPAPGAVLPMGATVTLVGTGENLHWSYDANSDNQGEVAIGSGNEVSFTVPTGVGAPRELTLMLRGDGGSEQQTYLLSDEATAAKRRRILLSNPRGAAHRKRVNVSGRKVGSSRADQTATQVLIRQAEKPSAKTRLEGFNR